MLCRVATLAFVVVACSCAASNAQETRGDSPEEFIRAWVASFNDFDPEQTLAFYDRSQETVVILAAGVRLAGYEAIQEMYQQAQGEVQFLNSSATAIQTRVLGDTALITFEHKFKTRVLADNSRWQGHVRTTSVLHRVGDDWKIVLEHSSPLEGIERITRIED